MLFFGRKQKAPTEPGPPAWADFMSPADWTAFARDVTETAKRELQSFRLDLRQGLIQEPEGNLTRGLLNLAQTYVGLPSDQRQAVVGQFLRLKPVVPTFASFEEARPFLRVRLFHPEVPSEGQVEVAGCPSFTSMVALDLPDSSTSLSRKVADEWGIPDDELIRIGLDNCQAELAALEAQRFGEGDKELAIFVGESFYVASMIYRLPDLPPAPELGCLVVVPNRHAICIHPIRGVGVREVLPHFRNMAEQQFNLGPGAISPDVIWVRNGAIRPLPITDEGVLDTVPAEFADVLRG